MASTELTKNARDAFVDFEMWLGWHPGDFKNAIAFAGDALETMKDYNDFRALVEAKYKPELTPT